jgi:hypothetical protein
MGAATAQDDRGWTGSAVRSDPNEGDRPGAAREACDLAGRWCQERGLHLMGFLDEGTGSSWTYLMAVG